MRAIALQDAGAARVGLIERPEPACGPQDVMVSMRAIGLCGSDLAAYRGLTSIPSYPWVFGHEGCGEIVAVGERVTDRHVGDHVVIEPNYCCLHCAPCRSGRTSACVNRRSLGLTEPGIAAERVVVPAQFSWVVPADVPWVAAACLEPHTVARAAARRAGVRAGTRCLVVGAGSQGLLMCLHLRSLGAEPFVIEPHDGRRRLALDLGARAHEPAGPGYPVVFETSGAPAAFRVALDATDRAGQLVLIGQSHENVQHTTRELVQRQITIRGSLIYDHPDDFAEGARMPAAQFETLTAVMRARYRPEEVAQALHDAPGIAGKSWLDLTDGWDCDGARRDAP